MQMKTILLVIQQHNLFHRSILIKTNKKLINNQIE